MSMGPVGRRSASGRTRTRVRPARPSVGVALALIMSLSAAGAAVAAESPGLTTWDGRHAIRRIDVTVVSFVPADRRPLDDWRERVGYLAGRIARFHSREFQGLSRLAVTIHPEPFVSSLSTAALRQGEADAIFFRTLREVDGRLRFGRRDDEGFPVLLILSDVNWRPLDDFSRLAPAPEGWRFEGSLAEDGGHVPGAAAGGSRATYLAEAGKGWGLVSADGWRVPMRGSDCVVYHEGVGHAIGLPHPEPADGSVMSLGQYRGWIGDSWVDESQKRRLGWEPVGPKRAAADLLAGFRAVPETESPGVDAEVAIRLDWPDGLVVRDVSVSFQTTLRGPWTRSPTPPEELLRTRRAVLGRFSRATPVAYRARLTGAVPAAASGKAPPERTDPRDAGTSEEVWGYLQVRDTTDRPPDPAEPDPTDRLPWREPNASSEQETVELLPLIDPARDAVVGTWQLETDPAALALVSPRAFGARIEIPREPPSAYRLTVVAEPLDEPGAVTLGLRSPSGRFLVLLGFRRRESDGRETMLSALENVDGGNVDANPTRLAAPLFLQGRPSLIVCTVEPQPAASAPVDRAIVPAGKEPVAVRVAVDGREIIAWWGEAGRLELADYWRTPRMERLFLGAYDCRWRFRRVTLESIAP
jgi:hypothetical protein